MSKPSVYERDLEQALSIIALVDIHGVNQKEAPVYVNVIKQCVTLPKSERNRIIDFITERTKH